jgi:hypothetical protein
LGELLQDMDGPFPSFNSGTHGHVPGLPAVERERPRGDTGVAACGGDLGGGR